MTVQVDIIAECRADFGAHRLGRIGARFALGALPRFLHRDIALVKSHLAAMADRHEDLAALILGAALKLPCAEILPALHDEDLGPSRSEEHTSELQSLIRIEIAVLYWK